MSSHREAFELMRRAVDNLPVALPDSDRVRILLLYSDAAGNVDRNSLAADIANRARDIALRIGDDLSAIEALGNAAAMARREGESLTSRRDQAMRMSNEIEAAPPGPGLDPLRIFGLSVMAMVEYDACRFAEARALHLEAREVAVRSGADPRWIDNSLAQLDVIDGRVVEGIATIRSIGEAVRREGQEDTGVGCHRDVALLAIRAMDFREASVGLDEGLRYAESVEQTVCGHILQSAEALISWADGRWDDAERQGGQALSDPGSAGSRMLARWALGYVEAGRGRRREAEEHLLPALAWARAAERVDVTLAAQWGLAEAALQAGDADGAAGLADEALRLAREAGEWTYLAPFAVIGVRAHQAAGRPDEAARYLDQFKRAIGPGAGIAEPAILHATGLVQLAGGSISAARVASRRRSTPGSRGDGAGRLSGPSSTWRACTCARIAMRAPWRSSARSRPPRRSSAASRCSARAAQLSRVARGRGEESEPWHPLTTREFEVARKIVAGRTNAELAEELGISPKTANSHVEHILAKLGVSRRAEIAAWASGVMSSPTASGMRPAAPRPVDADGPARVPASVDGRTATPQVHRSRAHHRRSAVVPLESKTDRRPSRHGLPAVAAGRARRLDWQPPQRE